MKILLASLNSAYWWAICLLLPLSTSWAALPTPPADDLPSSSKTWIDIGASLTYQLIGYACVIGGAVGCLAALSGIVKAYHTAQEKQDLGHFAKYAFASVLALVMCLALAYYADKVILA